MKPLGGKLITPIDPKLAAPQQWESIDLTDLVYPRDEWFTDEAADNAPSKITHLGAGQVAGVVAPAGRCLLDGRPGCWTVPRPADGRGSSFDCPDDAELRLAHVGYTVLASGAEIPTGTLVGAGGHHSFFNTPKDPAKSEYADTNRAVARGRYVWSDQAGGLVFIGALMPTIDEVKLAVLGCSAASIDYRWIEDEQRFQLYGSCLVNLGGLPSRFIRPVMAGASTWLPDDVLAAAAMEQQTVDYTIDGEPPDGAMLALIPDDPQALAQPGGEPAESLHLTLRYLGKAADWPQTARDQLAASVLAALGPDPLDPLEFTVASVGIIGSKGAGAAILNGDVADLRDGLAECAALVAEQQGVPLPDDHAGFLPHVTLRYDGDPPPTELIGTAFTASTVRLVFADEATDFHLGQPATSTKEPIMATTTPACGCGTPKLAAYKLVDGSGVPEAAEVLLPDGRTGQFCFAVKALDGTEVYIVRPLVDGHLASYEERVVVPAAEATLTGKEFQWDDDDVSYDAVLAAAVQAGLPAELVRLAAVDAAGMDPAAKAEQELASKVNGLEATLAELLAKVTDIHVATIDKALAAQGPLPALPG